MTVSAYPSIESDLFGATGDLPAAINTAHHNSGFPSSVPPDRKQLNKELNRLDQGMNYLLQGFPEFQVGQDYAIGRLITNGSKIYKSLLAQTAAAGDLTDNTKWELFSDNSSGFARTQKTVGANTTLTATDKFAKLTGANIATTLPLLSTVQVGDIFVIKNGNFFGNTVVPQGANTIDGVAGAELLMPYEMMQLRASVGLTEWEKI